MNKLTIIMLFLCLMVNIGAINENAGTSGFSFFKVQYSARAAAMGNAYTGLADEATGVFFNPAALVLIDNIETAFTYMNYLDGIHCGSAVIVYPRNDQETYAVFGQFLTATSERTLSDSFGELIETGEDFGMTDFLIGLSAGRYILKVLNLGVNVKYLQESLDGNSGSAIAADIGLLHQTTNENLKVGIAVKNLGTQLTYYSDSEYEERLPLVFTVGFNYHPSDKFYALLDINRPIDFDFSGRIGLEYQIHEMLALRAGYRTDSDNWRTGGDQEIFSGVSLGVGFTWKQYHLDYAVNSYGDLGFVNQVTLKYIFSK
ncbi:MAG: PorV/PorQ family protein [Candidatus Cloacimonetes bacterium]|nr:PorV/PorQ family protein [Candidatus Cloacimonadota bacterium]